MPYAATWTNANAQGRVEVGLHRVCLSDAEELAEAINRRRLLTYQSEQDFSSDIYDGAFVREATIAGAAAPPFDNFRDALAEKILDPPTGGLGGTPPTPSAMQWLWPESGSDENKIIVSGASGVGEGEVGLFQKLNGTNHWTDTTLTAGRTDIRAVHFNDLRQAVEWVRRGRWELPVYFSAGIFSTLPDTPWIGETIANDGSAELRTIGFAVMRTDETPVRGLTNVTARAASRIEITADTDCIVEIYHCLRPLEFVQDPPTWNEYDPSQSAGWNSPGGTGSGDATFIGAINLTADESGSLSNSALASALQAMIDGAQQNFLLRRSDTGPETIGLTGKTVIEFDADTPPN